jgi:tRNA pseudouridine55 synthase
VHGVLLLDKPRGLSSHSALARAKRAYNAAKGGHTGTLDPLATGLLPLCLGEATKFATDLLEADKAYRATLRLGIVTTTGDAEGEIIESHPVRVAVEAIDAALARFRGPILQIPPMYSALKRDGRPLYAYARAGITVDRPARAVTIHHLERVGFSGEELIIDVRCSKGTYIRTLAEDLGRALGPGAHLSALRRTAVGSLTLEAALALDALEALGEAERQAHLLPADTLVRSLPVVVLAGPEGLRFRQGQSLAVEGLEAAPRLRVYEGASRPECFLGVAEALEAGMLRPLRLIATSL